MKKPAENLVPYVAAKRILRMCFYIVLNLDVPVIGYSIKAIKSE